MPQQIAERIRAMGHRVADQLVRSLLEAGVERIDGVVGDSLNPVTDALRKNGKLQWIHVRHEETAAFAAGAEAQLTGKLAACAGSCGPGNLHLINGLYDAHRSMAPVLALASQIPSSEIGLGYFQETHPDQLFRECSHYSELISNPKQMPRLLQTAIQHAVGQSGVSVVSLPGTDSRYTPSPPAAAKTPQVAVGPEPWGRRSRLDRAVWGDVKEPLRCLTPRVKPKENRRFLDRMLKKHADALEGVIKAYTRK